MSDHDQWAKLRAAIQAAADALAQADELLPASPISVPADANAPHGERGDFLKVTATLSPEVYKLLSDEMQRRKLAREPNAQLSAILREAVLAYLTPGRGA
jgi:hypothetical protein